LSGRKRIAALTLHAAAVAVFHVAALPPAQGADTVQEAIGCLREHLTGPVEPDRPRAMWLSGSGVAMGMEMAVSFRYDEAGRFVLDARGLLSAASGYDGSTVWKQDPNGATRVLEGSDAHYVLVSHWIINGHWLDEDAGFEFAESERSLERGQMAISLRVPDSPLVGTVFVDLERWVPTKFIVNDVGMDHGIHFVSWQEAGERLVPREVFISNGVVDWGHERFKDVRARFVVENRGAAADRARDGIIGVHLLRRYRVVFDMVHGRIAYLPNHKAH
jgi:hypothetical protein